MSGRDPRIAPVEDNILLFVDGVRAGGPDWLSDRGHPFVSAYSSDVAFPFFNVVAGAKMDLVDEAELAESVGEEFIGRGVPWMWWTTPSHTSPELEGVLADLGLTPEDTPGMYAELDSVTELLGDIELAEVPVDDPDFCRVLVEGFELPDFVLGPIGELLGTFDEAEQVAVLARVDGEAAGVATGLIAGATVGVYNVATLAEFRGRGVGSATTSAVLSESRRRGCSHAILHTSPMGRGVYERLGFEVVCPTTQWLWTPSENG